MKYLLKTTKKFSCFKNAEVFNYNNLLKITNLLRIRIEHIFQVFEKTYILYFNIYKLVNLVIFRNVQLK